jgi:hypothetical protein
MSEVIHRKGKAAFALFALLSTAGVVTLFSQTRLEERRAHGASGTSRTALDPAAAAGDDLGNLLPSSLKAGAELLKEADAAARAKEPVLRLR